MVAAKTDHAASPGLVAVQAGKVVVRMPGPDSPKPTIAPGPHVAITVNGEPVADKVEVGENDEVVVQAVPDPPTTEVKIEISHDASEAVALVIRKPGLTYFIKDAPFAAHVEVTARPAGRLPAVSATVEQVQEALAKAGVVYGIDEAAIEALVARPELQVKGVVARWKPPAEPVDGHVRPYGAVESGAGEAASADLAAAETGAAEATVSGAVAGDEDLAGEPLKVDLLYRGEILSVSEGDIVAEWIEPVPGEDGVDVRGRPVRARKPKPVRVKLGRGVTREEGSRFVVAARMGRPVITEKLVDVVPSYEVPGDVNVATGHVEFSGDVVVRGNVEESLRVRAGGSVAVGGMVYRKARVEAGGSVTARGVVGGYVEAGGNSGAYAPVADLLRKLAPQYKLVHENLRRIQSTLASAGSPQPLGVYFKALLERHFGNVVKLAKELAELLIDPDSPLTDELKSDLARLVRHVTGRGPLRVTSLGDLDPYLRMLETLPEELDMRISEADVRVGYLQNAEIVSGGTVVVTGKACYNSKVVARSGFVAPNASIRGGSISVTKGNVRAKEIGSASAAATEIAVPGEGSIQAEVFFPNVVCIVGSRQYRFETPRRRVTLRLDPQTGELLF